MNYKSKYRREYGEDSQRSKEALERTNTYPGYALNMIRKKELNHMVHVNCETHGSERIFEHAEFTYQIDFPARKLWFWEQQCNGFAWMEVPFSKHLNTLQSFNIFERPGETELIIQKGPRRLTSRKTPIAKENAG
jgi:hypothetical protein